MKIKLINLIAIIVLFSCSNSADKEIDFLDFKLGISKDIYEKTIDTLLANEKIYKHSRRNYYRYNYNIDGNKIRIIFDGDFKYNELRRININIGELTKPDGAGMGATIMYYKSYKNDVENLLSLYKSKYGEPLVKYDWEEPVRRYEWVIENKVITFDKGFQENEYDIFSQNANIKYEFTDKYLELRNKESNKNSLDDL
nr:hypothetical protein [uncultured Psychroserpens sp.]